MPLYEYECQQCHRRTEKRQKFSDPEITQCPHCAGPLQRVISAPAIAFRGGGWYADGYGNAKPKSAGEDKASAQGKTEANSTETSAKPTSGDSSEATKATPAATPAPASAPASAPSKN